MCGGGGGGGVVNQKKREKKLKVETLSETEFGSIDLNIDQKLNF